MSLAAGTRIGAYEIAAQIGVGGMGEVYQASDTSLKRAVAIKVLPDAVAFDADRLARFQREAEVLASLNHPNIAAIYGLERTDRMTALVMELVEGPTLADRIAGGSIPIDEALSIASQICEALGAAHERGVIHRDLKPANIKVRPDGTVKVLDFGLAKAVEPTGVLSGLSQSPTITTPAMTQVGVILGTAAYMSPEQARGKAVDKRADIWAFGCVLFEMLSGRRLFGGDEVSDTLALVLTKDPDWDALPAETPTAIRRLLRRCLVRDPRARLPDIGSARLDIDDARLDIDDARTDPAASAANLGVVAPSGASARRSLTWAIVAMAVAPFVVLGVWMVMRTPSTDLPVTRALIGVGPADRLLSGFQLDASMGQGRPSRTAMAFSPDGRAVVFNAERAGRIQLYLRRLNQLEATAISGTENASSPFFSPDGESLGFFADGALKKVPLAGGPVVVVCKTDLVYGASWGRADQIVFAHQRGGLWQVPAAGGTPTAVSKIQDGSGEISHRLPQLLPDGQTVLFTVTKTGFPSWDDTLVVAQSLATGERKVLIDGGADARYAVTGHLIYLRRGTLMAVPFDLRRLEVTGMPVGLLADVMQAANIQPVQIDSGAGQFAVSESGSLIYATGGVFPQDRWSLVWVDRTGRSEALNIPPGTYLAPRLSPDGRRVAFGTSTGDWDLWTYDIARGIAARLPMEGDQSVPLWTPDGSRLAFSSLLGTTGGLFLRQPDGSGPVEQLTTRWGFPNSWTADGSALAVSADLTIWLQERNGKTERRSLVTSPAIESQAEFSPDGRWLAYTSGTDPRLSQTYVQPYPTIDRREQVSRVNGSSAAWRKDGREMYYVENASTDGPLKIRVMAVPITTTPTFSAGTPRMLFEGPFRMDGPFRGYDVTPDGQRFLMVREVPQPTSRVTQMVLVQNWLEELKRQVPTN